MNSNNLEIRDILMGAFLKVRGHETIDLRTDPDGRITFVVERTEIVLRDVADFASDGSVPARSLGREFAKLRQRCRDAKLRGQTVKIGGCHQSTK
jgi:hypothetical protein